MIPISDKLQGKPKIPQNISIDPDFLEEVIKVCQIEERTISSLFVLGAKQYIASHYPDGIK